MNQGAPRPRAEGISRVVLIDKPEGWTSFDVVRKSKGSFRGKIGHAGTLDPFATGLLLVLFGQATRLSSVLMDLPKEYLVRVQFGAVSSTADPTGDIEATGGRTDLGRIMTALESFRGPMVQSVPMTSAVKVGGERLYHKARRGETLETPKRSVMVYDHSVLGFDVEEQALDLLVLVGKGTYVRTLAEDLGEALGVGAYASRLRRRRIGGFDVSDAVTPDLLGPSSLETPDGRSSLHLSKALDFLPAHEVGADEARRVSNGNVLPDGPAGLFRVCAADGLLALYEGEGGETAKPRVVFPVPED